MFVISLNKRTNMETKSVRSIRLQFDFKQVKRITLFSVDFSTKEVAEKCLSNLDKRHFEPYGRKDDIF